MSQEIENIEARMQKFEQLITEQESLDEIETVFRLLG